MSAWHLGPMLAWDTETDGIDPAGQIVSATAASITPGVRTVVRNWLVAVERDIPAEATQVHGITTEHARAYGRPEREVVEELAHRLADAAREGWPLVGMNLRFDFAFLAEALRRNGLPSLEERIGGPVAPVVDAMVIDKALDKYRPGKRNLEALCQQYGVKLDGAHDAEFDALGAARVAWRIGQRASMPHAELVDLYGDRRHPDRIARGFTQLGEMSLDQLHDAQARWFAEQQRDFAAYLRRQAMTEERKLDRGLEAGLADEIRAQVEDLRARADAIDTEPGGLDWPVPQPAVQGAPA